MLEAGRNRPSDRRLKLARYYDPLPLVLLFIDPSSSRQRGALILLATTVPMFWSRLLCVYFANFILENDAALVGLLLNIGHTGNLALLWQIYSRCFSLQIHFLQSGHRCGDGRAMSSRMAWRTAGNVGRGGGPLILFFPPCCFKPAILEES
jgi:hypothetical protein